MWNLTVAFIFWQTKYLEPFWGTLGIRSVRGSQKGQNLPIPLKMTPTSWKLARRYNFWSRISHHKFFSHLGQNICYDTIPSILEVKKSKKCSSF